MESNFKIGCEDTNVTSCCRDMNLPSYDSHVLFLIKVTIDDFLGPKENFGTNIWKNEPATKGVLFGWSPRIPTNVCHA